MIFFRGHARALILSLIIAAAGCREVQAANSRSTLGFGWGVYSGAATNSIIPPYSPGIDFSTGWATDKRIELVSKLELDTIMGGTQFGSTGSPYDGFALIYKFEPHFYIVTDSKISPYFTTGPMVGAFGVLLTSLSSSQSASNNQASLKFGFTAGIGADYTTKKGGGSKSGGINFNMEYFYFTPTPSKFQFQAGNIEARGIRLTVGWYIDALVSKKSSSK